MSKQGYYYLHENGELIFKPAIAYSDADFNESDFVKGWWFVDTTHREDAWSVLVEALAMGAKKERIMELAEKWHCDDDDAKIFAQRIGVTIRIDGDKWMVHFKNFQNLHISEAGFGDTILEAMADLGEQMGVGRGVSFKWLSEVNS